MIRISNSFITGHEDIYKLEIYYIPWDLKTEARWTEYEVRDTTISYVSFFCTTDDVTLEHFSKCFLPDRFESKSFIKGVPPHMLIDIVYKSGKEDKLIIGPEIFLEYDQDTYMISEELKKWIKDFVPIAPFPSGEKNDRC